MILSNLCSFHATQILQNATALPAYMYRETNNKARANRKRHELSRQYWLKKQDITQQHRTQKNSSHTTTPRPKIQRQHNTQHDSQHFIPPPFPEKRAPVIINSQARRKPVNTTAKVVTTQSPATVLKTTLPKTTLPKDTAQNAARNTPRQPTKFIWKRGRGAVEKIDKRSGEIFHLVTGA